ncbi:MAG: ribonuclease HII [Balneolaceae bacterium]|nr:ribonuclease HII [Balneolaceae bacterium]
MTDRYVIEKRLWEEGYTRVMGLDEVGRGCLSGPVVAAGVILEPGTRLDELRDSKKLDAATRVELDREIRERARFWTVQQCSPAEIDRHNILQASLRAMKKCVEATESAPDYLLVDGNRFGSSLIPFACITGGDDRSATIAAASIIAKVYRDRLMVRLHEKYPHYGWDTNVGYPTEKHFNGLRQHGITEHHRRSFNLRTDIELDKGEDASAG